MKHAINGFGCGLIMFAAFLLPFSAIPWRPLVAAALIGIGLMQITLYWLVFDGK